MLKVFSAGRGGRHTNTHDAALWRTTTTQVTESIMREFPSMRRSLAITHAEDETATIIRAYNRAQVRQTGL